MHSPASGPRPAQVSRNRVRCPRCPAKVRALSHNGLCPECDSAQLVAFWADFGPVAS